MCATYCLDDGEAVADDRQREGDLQTDQRRAELVASQGAQHGQDIHGGLLRYCVFSCQAGCTRLARHDRIQGGTGTVAQTASDAA